MLAHVAGQVGDPQVRHRGTIGGSISHGDAASDLPAAVLALDGTFVVRGPGGERQIPASQFHRGFLETALAPDELLTEIRIPKAGDTTWSFQKFNRRAQDWAIVGVVAVRNGSTSIGLVNMASVPLRAAAVEAAIAGGASATDAAAPRRRGHRAVVGPERLQRVPQAPRTRARPPRPRGGWRLSGRWTVPSAPDDVARALAAHEYLADDGLATVVFLALKLQRPLFLEGEAGVGKTEVAKVLARWTGGELLRLQCYDGIDVSQAVYEWDYARQLLHLRAAEARGATGSDVEDELYSERFLVRRPLLQAITGSVPGADGPRSPYRRARPRRRRVRSLPARDPLRLHDHDPGAGHVPGRAAADRRHHVEPYP